MKALFTLGVVIAFMVPSTLSSIAKDHKTACPLKKGQAFLSGTYWTYSSDEFWNSNGKRRDAHNEFEKKEYNVHGEYGLTCRDTIFITGAWARIEESVNGRCFGFEDLEIGWKRYLGMWRGHYMSAELVGIIPVEKVYKPGLRYGEYGGEANLLLTRGFEFCERCGSYDLRIGYRYYSGFPSDQLRADAVVNLFPFSNLKLSAGGHLEYGLFNGSSKEDESFFVLNPDYRLLRGQLQATYYVYKGSSLFVGYQQHLWGRNVGTNGGIYAGAQILY